MSSKFREQGIRQWDQFYKATQSLFRCSGHPNTNGEIIRPVRRIEEQVSVSSFLCIGPGSISPTFYAKLLRAKISKAQN